MSWQDIYLHLDDAALAVWGNAGLLRRAKKALEADEVSVLGMGDSEGQWQNDGAVVALNAQGLTQASCNCPAAGACKHILAAVLHLQHHHGDTANSADAAVGVGVSVPVANSVIEADTGTDDKLGLPAWTQVFLHVDDAALAVWGNAGLLRRAQKALEAGEVSVLGMGDSEGQWQNDGAVVTLNAQGLTQAACNCPAVGACKHILAAVLHLQQQGSMCATTDSSHDSVVADNPSTEPLQAALTEVLDFERLQLGKIGKVQWRQAYALWQMWQQQDPPQISVQANKILFQTDLSEQAVVYVAGGGFTGMLSSLDKKRQLPTHLALVAYLWQQQQQPFAWPEDVLPDENTDEARLGEYELSLLQQLKQACERLLQLGLTHLMPAESQQWQWLQLSARVERLPRLAGMLRRLAGEVRLLADNHVSSDSNDTLLSVARLYAYVDALLHADADSLPALRGQLRRSYTTQSEAMTLLPLGVHWWQGEGGASGLNVYVWSVEAGCIMTAVQARSNGNDRSFSRYSAWQQAGFWNRSAEQIMTQQIVLQQPRVFGDRLANQVQSASQGSALVAGYFQDALTPLSKLQEQSIEMTMPFLLPVTDYEALYLDELQQSLEWLVYDKSTGWGAQLSLVITDTTRQRAEQLQWLCEKQIPIAAVLVLARLEGQQVVLEPVSVMRANVAEPVCSLDYHQLSPKQYYWNRKPSKPALLRAVIGMSSSNHWLETLAAPIWRLLEARSASGVRAWPSLECEQIQAVATAAEQVGLQVLAQHWQHLAQDASAASLLHSAHVMQVARQCQQQWPVFELAVENNEEESGA